MINNTNCHRYTAIGQDYSDTAVVPQFRSVIRSITSGHDAKAQPQHTPRNHTRTDEPPVITNDIHTHLDILSHRPLGPLRCEHTGGHGAVASQ